MGSADAHVPREANIPVCQLSIQTHKDGTHHYNMGKALAPLRDEGVLIIGSGSATHNLMLEGPDDAPAPSWDVDFENWLTESLLNGRLEDVNYYEEKSPSAKIPHPIPDHFYPPACCIWCCWQECEGRAIRAGAAPPSLTPLICSRPCRFHM